MSATNSSFDPLDFYHKLTQCLAKRKKCHFDRQMIPGLEKKSRNINHMPFSQAQQQRKFIDNYYQARQRKEQQQQAAASKQKNTSTEQDVSRINALNFHVKQTEPNNRKEKKKDDEAYINLPDSFFHSFKGPDMSIFKVPLVPAKQKSKKNPPPPPSSAGMSMSLQSLRSTDFKPIDASTPIEKASKPMIADADELLSKANQPLPLTHVTKRMSFKDYMALVDRTSKKIHEKCLHHIQDPVIDILNRVKKVYETSSVTPRAINESLITIDEPSPVLVSMPTFSLPVPEFFPSDGTRPIENAQQFDICKTAEIFNWSAKFRQKERDDSDDIFKSPNIPSPLNLSCLDFSPISPLLAENNDSPDCSFLFNTQFINDEARPNESMLFDDDKRKEQVDWNFHQDADDSFAIFKSPPISDYHLSRSRHNRQLKSQYRELRRKPQGNEFRKSQRNNLEDCFARHVDNSMSSSTSAPEIQFNLRRHKIARISFEASDRF